MGNLLFSPEGRINSGEFIKGAGILIVLGIILGIPGLLGMKLLATILGLVSLVFLYCWVVLWIKRYHDAGKSGPHCLIPIGIYVVLIVVLMFVVMGGSYMEIMSATMEGASEAEVKELTEAMEQKIQMPMMIGGAILSAALAFLFNMLIKSDPNDNQYGPAT